MSQEEHRSPVPRLRQESPDSRRSISPLLAIRIGHRNCRNERNSRTSALFRDGGKRERESPSTDVPRKHGEIRRCLVSQQRIRSGVAGRRESRGRTVGTGSTSDTDTRGIGSGLQSDNVTASGGDATLTAGQPQGRGGGRNSAGATAGRQDPLRRLRVGRRRRPVDVRRLPLAGHGGRGVDRRRLWPAEDTGDAEGRVLGIASGPQRRLADVEAERMVMIAQAAAGLAVLLLQQQLRRRGAAPGALELQVLLRYHRHLNLRLAGHAAEPLNRGGHHLLPWQFASRSLVQLARYPTAVGAKTRLPFSLVAARRSTPFVVAHASLFLDCPPT